MGRSCEGYWVKRYVNRVSLSEYSMSFHGYSTVFKMTT